MEDVKSIIEQLLPLLIKYNNGSITYQINQLNLVLSLIDENKIDEKEIFEIIRGVFPPRGGLSDFNVWHENPEKRRNINKPIGTLLDRLWNEIS